MSLPEPDSQGRRDCANPQRRRANPTLRRSRSRARDVCHDRPHHPAEIADHRHDRPSDPTSELEGFAHWFADWWLRRGHDLTNAHSQGGHDE